MGERSRKLQSCIKKLCNKKKFIDIVITERLSNNGEHEYLLHKLGLDVEDEGAYFYDIDDIIMWEDTSVLKGFLVSSMINDPKIIDNEINIIFKDGNINIKVLG